MTTKTPASHRWTGEEYWGELYIPVKGFVKKKSKVVKAK